MFTFKKQYFFVILLFVSFFCFSLISCKSKTYYKLTIQTENGSVKIEPDKLEYEEGTKVTLTATPDQGYDFSAWKGDETGGENPFTFVMNSDKNITAVFVVYYTANYYIDYVNGNDSSDGLTPVTAWKHAPGDSNATAAAAAINLQPGSRVIFKGGTIYRGQITIPADGSQNKHITYQGNAWPGLESKKSIIDGGDVLTGWTKCASASDCAGNNNFNSIYYAYLPASVDPLSVNLHEYDTASTSDNFLWPSQTPNPSDFYFYDNRHEFHTIQQSGLTRTSITDPDFFNQTDASYWNDSYLLIWINPNMVATRKILTYSPSDHRVTFDDLGENAIYPDGRDQSYAIFNSPHAIDRAGEYFITTTPDSNNRLKILLWPRSEVNLDSRITYSVRKWGIDINTHSNVTIEGFSIIKHSGTGLRDGVGIGTINAASLEKYNLVIKNNYITHNRKGGSSRGYGGIYLAGCSNVLVEGNEIIDNPCQAGIFFSGGAHITAKGNTIIRSGSTSLRFYSIDHGVIDGNTIRESNGSHANGITIYIGSKNILVINNRVIDSGSPVTFEDSGNLWFINNLIDACERDSNVNEWDETTHGPWEHGIIAFLNNTIVRNNRNASLNIGGVSDLNTYISINNIIDGGGGHSSIQRSNNIYTGLQWNQSASYGWFLEDGESIEQDLSQIFVNPANNDFKLTVGSPAIDAGIDITPSLPLDVFPEYDFTRDIDGNIRTGWDIGAYDYN